MLFFIGTHAQKACNRSLRDRLQAYRMAAAMAGRQPKMMITSWRFTSP